MFLNEKQGKDTKLNDRFMTSHQQNNRPCHQTKY